MSSRWRFWKVFPSMTPGLGSEDKRTNWGRHSREIVHPSIPLMGAFYIISIHPLNNFSLEYFLCCICSVILIFPLYICSTLCNSLTLLVFSVYIYYNSFLYVFLSFRNFYSRYTRISRYSSFYPWRRAWPPISVFLLGESPWTEEPGGLQSMGSQRVRHEQLSRAQWVLYFHIISFY